MATKVSKKKSSDGVLNGVLNGVVNGSEIRSKQVVVGAGKFEAVLPSPLDEGVCEVNDPFYHGQKVCINVRNESEFDEKLIGKVNYSKGLVIEVEPMDYDPYNYVSKVFKRERPLHVMFYYPIELDVDGGKQLVSSLWFKEGELEFIESVETRRQIANNIKKQRKERRERNERNEYEASVKAAINSEFVK